MIAKEEKVIVILLIMALLSLLVLYLSTRPT